MEPRRASLRRRPGCAVRATPRQRPETKPGEAGLGGGERKHGGDARGIATSAGEANRRKTLLGGRPSTRGGETALSPQRTNAPPCDGRRRGPWGNHGFPHGQTYVCWSRHVRHIATPHSTSTATNASTWRPWAPPYQLTPRSATASSPAP